MSTRHALAVLLMGCVEFTCAAEHLPGTKLLEVEGDLSARMVQGIHRWLAAERARVDMRRGELWRQDAAEWTRIAPLRRMDLARQTGATEPRRPGALTVQREASEEPATTSKGTVFVERVAWPVFDHVQGEGLFLRTSQPAKGAVIAVPDAAQTPEQFAGIHPGIAPGLQHARKLAERGFLVVVPTLVDRGSEWAGSELLGRWTNVPHREWIHRQCFEAGRTLPGFEAQKVLAVLDALRGASAGLLADGAKIGVLGHGEGGLVALHAAALDERITAVLVDGYFGAGESDELIDRNIFARRVRFTDAGLAAMIAPRPVGVMRNPHPMVPPPAPRHGARNVAAPGSIASVEEKWFAHARNEADALRRTLGAGPVMMVQEATAFMSAELGVPKSDAALAFTKAAPANDAAVKERQRRTVRELEDFSQRILREAEFTRKASPLWDKLRAGAQWDAAQKQARKEFWEQVIGRLPRHEVPHDARTRLIHDREKWRGYEVMLDVQQDIFAWGVLLLPKDLKPGERRPVVVCQHGLEGVPENTITEDRTTRAWASYKAFAARLCERGFIVYAPANPYRGGDDFRRIQREANPLGLSLFSFIIAQHDVTTRWLASLPFVDPERIAFYGLSYGGKTAMRVPAVLERYCLSICSADFNEWVMKCSSTTHPAGYVFTNEWEIWEWNLAHTFNYAEMAMLIAPRPFMVERGHDDGVGLDEHVGYEWGKVRRAYDKLGIGERAEIEWFDGPHTIHGVGTFAFLHKWLRWPEPR